MNKYINYMWCKTLTFSTLLALFIFCQNHAQAQAPNVDSLLSNIPTQKDNQYIDHLCLIARFHSSLDTAMVYAMEAIALARQSNYHKANGELAHCIGAIYNNQYNYEAALPYFEEALAQFDIANLPAKKIKTLRGKGFALVPLGKNSEGLQVFLEALELSKEHNLEHEEAKILSKLGNLYRLQHDVERAIPYFNQAEQKYRQLNMSREACLAILGKANTWKVSMDTNEMRLGLNTFLQLVDGECWSAFDEYSKAKLVTSLGSILIADSQYELGEKYLLQGYEIKKKENLQASLLYTYNELCTFYYDIGNHQKSIEYGEQALASIDSFPNPSLEYDILRNLSNAYSHSGDYKHGFYALRKSKILEENIRGEAQKAALYEMETKFNIAKKEEEIAKRDLELARQDNRFNRLAMLAILAVGLLSGLYFWMRYRLSKRALESEQIREVERLRSAFFTNISHEFRTPLSLILVPLRKWEKQFFSNNTSTNSANVNREEVQQMGRNAQRLESLIGQLLDLSKMDAGKIYLQASKGDLAGFSESLVESFQELAKGRNIQLQFASFKEPFEVYFDIAILEKVLFNLLSNALKFTPENGKIKILVNEKAGLAEITVSNSGPGISADELPLIFDRFYQANNGHLGQGTGIGLALVKELVHLHKGTVDVSSKVGINTTFRISLTLGKQHLLDSEIKQSKVVLPEGIQIPRAGYVAFEKLSVEESMPEPTGQRPSILVVEDNDDLRRYLAAALNDQFDVLTASDGKMGLESALENIPDLVLSDVMMPGMSGTSLCAALKSDERTSHIPVILLTAKATREDELDGLQNGADDYLTKPFDEEILLKKVLNLIQQRNRLKMLFSEKIELRPHELEVSSHEEGFLKKLLDITEENLSDPDFSIEKLSKEINMSRSQLFRKLKALSGETPTTFIRNIRLRRAKQLLEQQFGNVNEVAFAVGFSNSNYFFKCFKEAFGMTPGEAMKAKHRKL